MKRFGDFSLECDGEYIYLTIPNKGRIVIKDEDDGIVIDVLPVRGDDSVGHCWVDNNTLGVEEVPEVSAYDNEFRQ